MRTVGGELEEERLSFRTEGRDDCAVEIDHLPEDSRNEDVSLGVDVHRIGSLVVSPAERPGP
jgi:hypothetical protein